MRQPILSIGLRRGENTGPLLEEFQIPTETEISFAVALKYPVLLSDISASNQFISL
jgi:hypothetical protein